MYVYETASIDILRRLKYALIPKVDSISMATVANGAAHQTDILRFGRIADGASCHASQLATRVHTAHSHGQGLLAPLIEGRTLFAALCAANARVGARVRARWCHYVCVCVVRAW